MDLSNTSQSVVQPVLFWGCIFFGVFWGIPFLFRLWRNTVYRSRGAFWSLKRFYHFLRNLWRHGWSWQEFSYGPRYFRSRRQGQSSAARIYTPYLQSTDEKFRPWVVDYWKAGFLCLVGIGWIIFVALHASTILSVLSYPANGIYYIWALAMLSVGPFYLGASYLQCGLSRKRGKGIEIRAKKSVAAILPDGWTVLPDMRLDSGEDVDLPIRLPGGDIGVVEIKSWNYGSGFVRKRKAIAQVHRQRRALDASYSIIWLPKAKERYVGFHRRALVVCGSRQALIREIQGMIVQQVTIKFPSKPNYFIRRRIKTMGFIWITRAYSWSGRCSTNDVAKLEPHIIACKGSIRIDTKYQGEDGVDGYVTEWPEDGYPVELSTIP